VVASVSEDRNASIFRVYSEDGGTTSNKTTIRTSLSLNGVYRSVGFVLKETGRYFVLYT
jgi:hypothetical protein